MIKKLMYEDENGVKEELTAGQVYVKIRIVNKEPDSLAVAGLIGLIDGEIDEISVVDGGHIFTSEVDGPQPNPGPNPLVQSWLSFTKVTVPEHLIVAIRVDEQNGEAVLVTQSPGSAKLHALPTGDDYNSVRAVYFGIDPESMV